MADPFAPLGQALGQFGKTQMGLAQLAQQRKQQGMQGQLQQAQLANLGITQQAAQQEAARKQVEFAGLLAKGIQALPEEQRPVAYQQAKSQYESVYGQNPDTPQEYDPAHVGQLAQYYDLLHPIKTVIKEGADGFYRIPETGEGPAEKIPGITPKEDKESLTSLQKNLEAAGYKRGTPEYKKAITDSVTKPLVSMGKTGGKLGEKMVEKLIADYDNAESAKQSLVDNIEAKKLLDSGIITGTGAEYIVSAGKALQQAGFNLAPDAIANTEAYAAYMGRQVGRIIKLFGSGTGLSDADREYAEKIVGGKITVNEQSLRKIIDMNDRGARNVINFYNKKAKTATDRIGEENLPYSLMVEMPKGENGVTEETPGQPQKHASPTTQEEFDALPPGATYIDPDDGKIYRKQ